jgi:hypothetical protein
MYSVVNQNGKYIQGKEAKIIIEACKRGEKTVYINTSKVAIEDCFRGADDRITINVIIS